MKTNLIKRTRSLKKDFVLAHNKVVQNSNVSFEAKGLLMLLLSLPDDWVIHKNWIMKEYKIGRDKLNRLFTELIKNGYMVEMDMIRDKGKFIGKNYMVYDAPQNGVLERSPMYRKPSTVEPHTDESLTANSTTTKNIPVESTDNKKENTLTKGTEHNFSFISVDQAHAMLAKGSIIPSDMITEQTFNELLKTYSCDNDGNIKAMPF